MPGGSTKKLTPSEQRRSEERLAKYGPKKMPLEEKTLQIMRNKRLVSVVDGARRV